MNTQTSQARTVVALFAAALTLALATTLGATGVELSSASDEPTQGETITAGKRSP